MHEIGQVVKLQVQTGPLKQGPHRERYDPTHLLAVPTLEMSERGVVGWCEGKPIQDVHHQDYAFNQGHKGHILSFNFTSHYEQMRQRYGEHLGDGCGGDNIVFAAATPLTLSDLQGDLVIETQTGQQGRLTLVMASTPCLSFSRFAIHQPNPDQIQLKAALQFLRNGQRGFYASYEGSPILVQHGDRLIRK